MREEYYYYCTYSMINLDPPTFQGGPAIEISVHDERVAKKSHSNSQRSSSSSTTASRKSSGTSCHCGNSVSNKCHKTTTTTGEQPGWITGQEVPPSCAIFSSRPGDHDESGDCVSASSSCSLNESVCRGVAGIKKDSVGDDFECLSAALVGRMVAADKGATRTTEADNKQRRVTTAARYETQM